MNSTTIFINALGLVVQLSIPFVIVAFMAGLISGIFKVVSQIEDHAIGFASRFIGISLVIYFGGNYFLTQVTSFAQRVWGGNDFYY